MKILYGQTKQRELKIKGRYQEMEQQFCGVLKMKALNTKLLVLLAVIIVFSYNLFVICKQTLKLVKIYDKL